MLDNSYLIGLAISTKISLWIGIIFFIVMFFIYSISDRVNSEIDGNYFGLLVYLFIVTLGVSISSFLLIYPLCNLILQKYLNLELYQKEISQGTLALRITSLLLGFNFLKSLYNYLADKLLENQNKLIADYPDLKTIEPQMDVNNIVNC